MRPLQLIVLIYGPKVALVDPYWFYACIFCQSSGFAVGYVGFITRIIFGSRSEEIRFYRHLVIEIILVILDVRITNVIPITRCP
jgi:hypothetical protein